MMVVQFSLVVITLMSMMVVRADTSFSMGYVPRSEVSGSEVVCADPIDNRARDSVYARWQPVREISGHGDGAHFSLNPFPDINGPFWDMTTLESQTEAARVLGPFAARSKVIVTRQSTVHGDTMILMYDARVIWFEEVTNERGYEGTGVILEGDTQDNVYISVFRSNKTEELFVLTAGELMVDAPGLSFPPNFSRTSIDLTEEAIDGANNPFLPGFQSTVSMPSTYADGPPPTAVPRVNSSIALEAIRNTRNLRSDINGSCKRQAERWEGGVTLEGIYVFSLQDGACRAVGRARALLRLFGTAGEGSNAPQLSSLSAGEGIVLALIPAVVESLLVIVVVIRIRRECRSNQRNIDEKYSIVRWEIVATALVMVLLVMESAFLIRSSIAQSRWPRCRYADFGFPCGVRDEGDVDVFGNVFVSSVTRAIECYVDTNSDWVWAIIVTISAFAAFICLFVLLMLRYSLSRSKHDFADSDQFE